MANRICAHRSLVVLLAALACLVCSFAPTEQALAQQGSASITQAGEDEIAYDAYLVFRADIAEDGTARHIAWPDEATKKTVVSYLYEAGYENWLSEHHPDSARRDAAQIAAEFTCEMIEQSPAVDGAGTANPTTHGLSFATGLARALASDGPSPTATVESGQKLVGEQGYWLLVTDPESLPLSDSAGTAPIWLPLHEDTADVEEKSSLPTLTYLVQEDSSGAWAHVADCCRGQALAYRMSGTLPANFDAYPSYRCHFEAALPEGAEICLESDNTLSQTVAVTIEGKNVPIDGQHLSADYDGHLLTLDFDNLHDDYWNTYDIDSTSVITIEYRACLNDAACIGAPGNRSQATLAYTADPVSLQMSQTKPQMLTVFTYRLELFKKDQETGEGLEGAVFSLQELVTPPDNDQTAEDGTYIRGDGTRVDDVYTIETGANGRLAIEGLDEGTYRLREVAAPEGYVREDEPTELIIRTRLDDTGQLLEELEVTSSSKQATVLELNPEEGHATLGVDNAKAPVEPERPVRERHERLPQTGVGPLAGILIASGLAIAGLSLARRLR